MPRTAPITKTHLIQNVSNAEVQKLVVALYEHDRSFGRFVCPDDLFRWKPAAQRQQVLKKHCHQGSEHLKLSFPVKTFSVNLVSQLNISTLGE